MTYQLIHGDCLDVLPGLQAGSIDAVITDPPYGTTACAWDTVIPFDAMWKCIRHVVKPSAAVVLFGSQPFTSALVMSNPQWFKYQWVWDKKAPTGILNAPFMPLKRDEQILIFTESIRGTYNPQMSKGKFRNKGGVSGTQVYGRCEAKDKFNDVYHPTTILEFSNANRLDRSHPTQKPVELLRYLIRTYTNPGDTVLDFTMGSGSTIVAAIMEWRNAIGIEIDAGYFAIAERRCADAAAQPRLLDVEPTQPTTEQAQLFV